MRNLASFVMTSLDGFYEGPNQEFDWAIVDDEFTRFSLAQLSGAGTLVFGRVTYLGMAEYWTTDEAIADNPGEGPIMNGIGKVVVSSTLTPGDASWGPIEIVDGDLHERFVELKARDGGELLVLGSPTLTVGLAEAGLLDELRLMISPVALGEGRSLFSTATGPIPFELVDTRRYASGNLLVTYRPR